jgi:hypothetical protein
VNCSNTSIPRQPPGKGRRYRSAATLRYPDSRRGKPVNTSLVDRLRLWETLQKRPSCTGLYDRETIYLSVTISRTQCDHEWDRLLGTSRAIVPSDRFWAVSHGWCPVVKAYSFICIQYLYTDYMIKYKYCNIQDVYLIQDTFITFSRSCEAARQIGKDFQERRMMYCNYGRCRINNFLNLHSCNLNLPPKTSVSQCTWETWSRSQTMWSTTVYYVFCIVERGRLFISRFSCRISSWILIVCLSIQYNGKSTWYS